MNKEKAYTQIGQYLKSHFIQYFVDEEDGVPRYTMVFKNCFNCLDKMIESCIYFYDDCMEVKTYYTQSSADCCKNHQENLPDVICLLNYINATVWMNCSDGANGKFYKSSILYTPRLFMTEDDCYDITLTTLIPYDFYEVAPLETEDYITAYCPELLNRIYPAIYILLTGDVDLQHAKQLVDRFIRA